MITDKSIPRKTLVNVIVNWYLWVILICVISIVITFGSSVVIEISVVIDYKLLHILCSPITQPNILWLIGLWHCFVWFFINNSHIRSHIWSISFFSWLRISSNSCLTGHWPVVLLGGVICSMLENILIWVILDIELLRLNNRS